MSKATNIEEEILFIHRALGRANYLPVVETITGPSTTPRITIKGHEMINFCTNSYLNLSFHPMVVEASRLAVEKSGTGSGASRFTGGTQNYHIELEETLARFKDPSGKKKALVFSTGYNTNAGAISALLAPPLLRIAEEVSGESKSWGEASLFLDHAAHRCIIEGGFLAEKWSHVLMQEPVTVYDFAHNNAKSLERKIKKHQANRMMVCFDGVYSLNGHIAPIDEYVALKRQYNTMLYMDDAHGSFVLGDHGRGTAEYLKVEDDVDIQMGTLSKAAGSAGGYIVANAELVEYLRYSSSSYLFQTAMPPGQAAGLIAALKILESEEGAKLRAKLWSNVDYLNKLLASNEFDTMGSLTQIVPVKIGDESKAIEVAERLKDYGIYAPAYYYNAVPKNQAIIRINVTASHDFQDLDHLVDSLKKACSLASAIAA